MRPPLLLDERRDLLRRHVPVREEAVGDEVGERRPERRRVAEAGEIPGRGSAPPGRSPRPTRVERVHQRDAGTEAVPGKISVNSSR